MVTETSVHDLFFMAFRPMFGWGGHHEGDHVVELNNSPHSKEEEGILVSETLLARFSLLVLLFFQFPG